MYGVFFLKHQSPQRYRRKRLTIPISMWALLGVMSPLVFARPISQGYFRARPLATIFGMFMTMGVMSTVTTNLGWRI